MLAFTLVSLMLSLFGGVFAALSAFRNFSEIDVKERCNRMNLHLEEFKAHSKNNGNQVAVSQALVKAEAYADKMQRARKWWTGAQIFPTVVFLGFALFMGCWALLNWNSLTQPQSWEGWKWILGGGIFVDIASLGAIALAWKSLRSASNDLDGHAATVKDFLAEIKPDPQAVAQIPN